jgi:hypothetical protein
MGGRGLKTSSQVTGFSKPTWALEAFEQADICRSHWRYRPKDQGVAG